MFIFQTAETVESIVTQLMEKQRCARAAALSGKSLDCPGCNDPNQECSLHHVPGKISSLSFKLVLNLMHCTGTTPNSVVQSTTGSVGGGRRVQATKSEAHTTTSGRPRSHKRMIQHRLHENNNQVREYT